MKNMDQNAVFEYNSKQKFVNGLMLVGFIFFAAFFISLYFLYFNKLNIKLSFLDSIMIFFKNQISNYTLLGIFMISFVGGLFFIPLPMEIIFARYIAKSPNPLSVFFVYMFGLTLSYSLDLLMGYKFSGISKKLVSTKKFYQIKCKINKYGKFAFFLTNILPLPSQLVGFILGVFKYNKAKYYIQFWVGQSIKLLIIMGFVLFIGKIF